MVSGASTEKIWFLITSHNRVTKTRDCLKSIEAQTIASPHFHIVLADANSADGTKNLPREFPNLKISLLNVGERVFWAEGMKIAETFASLHWNSACDLAIWLNDDVFLDPDAIGRLLDVIREDSASELVVVGAMRSSDHSRITFSGLKSHKLRPAFFTLVAPSHELIAVDTFHGNLVGMRAALVETIGGIRSGFFHHSADIEFGLRNTRYPGHRNLLLPGTLGTCDIEAYPVSTGKKAWRLHRSVKGSGHRATRAVLGESLGVAPVLWHVLNVLADVKHLARLALYGFQRLFQKTP